MSPETDFAAPETAQIRILTAEDDPEFSDTLAIGLQVKGYQTLSAHNGAQALALFSKEPVDLVVSDVRMPDMDGIQLLKKIREQEADRRIKTPFIIITGYSDYDAVVQALKAGASDFLAKPFGMDEFFHTLSLHLQLKSLQLERASYERRLEATIQERTQELLTANEHLKRLSLLKDAFVSMVSHELRDPLQLIRGHADLLLHAKNPLDFETLKTRLTTVIDETDRLTRLIHDLLKIESIQSSRIPLRLSSHDLASLATEVTSRFKSTHPAVPVRLDIPKEPAPAEIDSDKITEVLINLIENAIKYSPAEKGVDVTVRAQDSQVEFRVRDHGAGIPKEDIERVFESFFRGKAAGNKQIKGFGLGLTICRSIIEAHHGKIWVESDPGQGAAFIVQLPKSQNGPLPG